jgi:hypothetical protein
MLITNRLFLFFILGAIGKRRGEGRFLGYGLKGPLRRFAGTR